jgi:biotin operon repressor
MKNTDPPSTNGHRVKRSAAVARLKLTPQLHRFIQQMGGYFESSGVPPIGGRILGLLMIAHEPLSAEDIASILNVSRASVSTNFRVLAAAGLAERFTSHADRTTYYAFPDTAWEQAMVLGARRAQSFKRIVDDGLAAMPENDAARWHLLRGSEYADLVIEFFQRQIDEWRTHHQKSAPLPSWR